MSECRVAFGEILREQIRQAAREVFLVAPFVKAATLARVLAPLRTSLKLVCVTRWRPEEIATGVSDIEAYEVVTRQGGTFWLRQDLHAKYYRCDGFVGVGSANLTNAALGWSAEPNLELMVPVSTESIGAKNFEDGVLGGAVQVDGALYGTVASMLQGWRTETGRIEFMTATGGDTGGLDVERWMPLTREPGDLYQVYMNPHGDSLPRATRDAGVCDLAALQLPRGLQEREFNIAIGVRLVAMPMVSRIDRELATPQRFGAVRNLIRRRLGGSESDASRLCQTLIRWLRYFLGSRYGYRRPGYSEVIGRRTAKGHRSD